MSVLKNDNTLACSDLPIIMLLNAFLLSGPYGNHVCLV